MQEQRRRTMNIPKKEIILLNSNLISYQTIEANTKKWQQQQQLHTKTCAMQTTTKNMAVYKFNIGTVWARIKSRHLF